MTFKGHIRFQYIEIQKLFFPVKTVFFAILCNGNTIHVERLFRNEKQKDCRGGEEKVKPSNAPCRAVNRVNSKSLISPHDSYAI